MTETPLWTPSADRIISTRRTAFLNFLESRGDFHPAEPSRLHSFSIERMDTFWRGVWDFGGVIGELGGPTVLQHEGDLAAARFFPDARLNYAENLLFSAVSPRHESEPALIFRSEAGRRRDLTLAELRAEVASLVSALEGLGVKTGDRVCGWLPNTPEAVVAYLATTALGAIWASASPDFGVEGLIDRFGQIEPKVLFAADGYTYGGKRFDNLDRLAQVCRRLPSMERLVLVPNLAAASDLGGVANALLWDTVLAAHRGAPLRFVRWAFDHPLAVLFSSGTTGPPKCIVHRAGGVLLQHLKEHQLHCDVRRGDRVFYFTTTSWMMWNWLISALASEAIVVLYDGSPLHPGPEVLFDLAEENKVTLFGTSARFLGSAEKAQLAPGKTHRLEALRTLTSTGSPLSPSGFDYVYSKIKEDVHLASISGGTDLCACFVGGDPNSPVWRGEIQEPCLGMAVEVFDPEGRPLPAESGESGHGELVCTEPFPSQPLGFWNDESGVRYRTAYYERFPGAWHHGDCILRTRHGGFVILGRSDATLNPGGVRIGTAEIYRIVECFDEVLESLAVGQRWQGDERIILFLRLRPGTRLDSALAERIRSRLRLDASPRHVPAHVVAVADLPRTHSGKLVEIAVREVLHGRTVWNLDAIANPESLGLFTNLPELTR